MSNAEDIRAAQQEWKNFRAEWLARQPQMYAEASATVRTRRDETVKAAYNAGMSKAAIMRAMGTTDYRTVQNILHEIAPTRKGEHATTKQAAPMQKVKTVEREDGTVDVFLIDAIVPLVSEVKPITDKFTLVRRTKKDGTKGTSLTTPPGLDAEADEYLSKIALAINKGEVR